MERPSDGIFTTFLMAGFECSTFLWMDGNRRDYVSLTGHDRHIRDDYRRAMELGIGTVREGIRWPLVQRGSSYDWSTLEPVIDAANEFGIDVIWDLCHYGFPDGFDPFDPDAASQFARYCRATAELIAVTRPTSTPFFTPVNEITFFSGAATEMGWMYPFARGRYAEMKRALCRMAIAGAHAIREVAPAARMVNVDPLIYEMPATHSPELEFKAREETFEVAFEAWDILSGIKEPGLGGSPDILDIVGLNIYAYCRSLLNADGTRQALGPRGPRAKPLNEMLKIAWDRYHRPMIIGETSGSGDGRADWLKMVMQESLIALNDGVDLQGICLFPCVDMPDWQSGQWSKIGIFDILDEDELTREAHEPYVREIRRWQKILDRPHEVSGNGPLVNLDEVRQKAREWGVQLNEREAAEHALEQKAA